MEAFKKPITEVWAQLFLCDKDRVRVRDFFINEFKIKPKSIIKKMHLTVYYSRRPMPGVVPTKESVSIIVPAEETRFMVLAPGGENPRPDLEPKEHRIGIRIHKQSRTLEKISDLRSRLLRFETKQVLGSRAPSTNKTNAFGAQYFQPHVVFLEPQNEIGRELSLVGKSFRNLIGALTFDRFEIKITNRILPSFPTQN